MANNSDKSKVFCKIDFHVGGVPYVPMSAYEPKHHSVLMAFEASTKAKNHSTF